MWISVPASPLLLASSSQSHSVQCSLYMRSHDVISIMRTRNRDTAPQYPRTTNNWSRLYSFKSLSFRAQFKIPLKSYLKTENPNAISCPATHLRPWKLPTYDLRYCCWAQSRWPSTLLVLAVNSSCCEEVDALHLTARCALQPPLDSSLAILSKELQSGKLSYQIRKEVWICFLWLCRAAR